jgi:hypothetical protein
VKKRYLIGRTIIFLSCLSSLAYAEDIPEIKECISIILRASDGWWLRINNDGSGTYGFGVQLDKVEVKEDTFDFKRIYTETKQASFEKRKNAEGAYIAVSYYIYGSSSAREYYLSQKRKWLAKLFFIASENALPPSNDFEKRWHDRIETLWKNSPFTSPHKPDAGDGK